VTQLTEDDRKEHTAQRRTQIWIAVITAIGTLVAAAIGLIGTLRATDSKIVSGPAEPGPTVTRTVTVAPTATVTETVAPNDGGNPGSGPDSPAVDKVALDVNWKTNAGAYKNKIGLVVQFDCPPRGIPQGIAGDRIYFGESSVCTAGVHDGRISLDKGGRLIIEIREGASSYPGTRRNGITSKDAGPYFYSFEFLPPS
jgi:LCCL domain